MCGCGAFCGSAPLARRCDGNSWYLHTRARHTTREPPSRAGIAHRDAPALEQEVQLGDLRLPHGERDAGLERVNRVHDLARDEDEPARPMERRAAVQGRLKVELGNDRGRDDVDHVGLERRRPPDVHRRDAVGRERGPEAVASRGDQLFRDLESHRHRQAVRAEVEAKVCEATRTQTISSTASPRPRVDRSERAPHLRST